MYSDSRRKVCARLLAFSLLLLSATVPAAPVLAAPQGAPETAPLVAVPKLGNGVLLAPGASKKLKVKVTDRNNRPIAGASVVFIAPEKGPSGRFRGASPADATFVRATTNAKGVARATFTAGADEGVFLVDALVEGTEAATTFGITVTAAQVPALTAAKARQAVLAGVLQGETEDELLRLHGPVLVVPGASVAPAGPGSTFFPSAEVTVDRPTWLFWVDEDPRARFGHATRFVLVDATDTTPDRETEARVLRQVWWPVVTLPGTTAPASLLPPFLANDGGEAAIATGAARQTWPVGRGEAPSDACAILLHGRGVGGYVDVMNMAHSLVDQQLVPSDHILSTGSPLTGVPPPATRQDIERLVDTAVMNGCRKVYIYISSHGFASTSSDMGGVALSTPEQPDGSVADDPVRWDELMELFEPLSGKELCVIVDACFSGEGCEWFQGRGSTGVFVSAADSDHPSYSRDRVRGVSDGGAYTTALIGCWEDDSADSNGDGTVTLAEASLCVEQSFSDDFYIASPQPKTTSIQPNGPRNFGLLGAAHPRAGETFQIMIRRPMDLPLDVTFLGTLTIADPSVVSFTNGGATHQFRLFPGELTYEVDVMGHEEGGSDYSIGGLNLRDNIAYDGTATILVGLSYFATPNPVEINLLGGVNPVTVTLVRRGPIAYIGRDVTVLLFHFDSVIAKPRVDEIEFKPGDENMEFLVDGLSLGMMTISIIDSLYGLRVDLPVMVVNGTACALPGTAVPVTFTVQADPGGHHPSVGLGSADLTFTSQPNSQARIQSNDSQVVTATGGFDASTCTISVAGGMGTIAGFPGVRCEYRNIVISSSGNKATRVEGEYACGVGGELPGGQPIVYRFSGTAP